MKRYFPKHIKVIVAIDGSVTNWRWLKKLKEYINCDNCRITLVSVAKNRQEKNRAVKFLDVALSLMQDEDILYMHEATNVLIGDPTEQILNFASNGNFDFIIVGSHCKTAVERIFMGSVSTSIVQQSGIPVLVFKMDS